MVADAWPRLVFLTGSGMSFQSSKNMDVPLTLAGLTSRLLKLADLGELAPDESINNACAKLAKHRSPREIQSMMTSVLMEGLDVNSMQGTVWEALFKAGLPVVTENYDLHAAAAMYWWLNGKAPDNIDSLADVILTWESSLEERQQMLTLDFQT
eukprot:552258-Amphidinium_carterae.1